MFGSVALNIHSVEDYAALAGPEAIARLRELAEPLRGIRVLNLSSPSASGAVRSLLQSKVPLLTDLGIDAYWQQVRIAGEYLEMDRQLRRALSGYPVRWNSKLESDWWQFNLASAQSFDETFEVVIVHHTASVGLYAAICQLQGTKPPGVWIWDSHRDYRAALPEAWSLIRRHADEFAASIYDYKLFIRQDAPTRKKVVVSPGLDPLGPRARSVPHETREMVLGQRGIDVTRPMIAQIVLSMREDDPTRVLETYRLVVRRKPGVQLVIAHLVPGTPETGEQVEELRRKAAEVGDVIVLTDVDRVGNVELCALRDQASVLIHQGAPRGISLELIEEMWQGRPIVSSRSSVAQAVLTHRKTALLADGPAEQAKAVLEFLNNEALAERIRIAAHETVANRYLITHHLEAELRLLRQVLGLDRKHQTASTRRAAS